jgi:hypothetical protein
VAYHAAFALERRVTRVIARAGVRFPLFIPTISNVRGAQATNGSDVTEEMINDVTPMAEHIDDDSAAVFFAIIPRGPLHWLILVLACEHPVSKLPADTQNSPEKALIPQGA